MIKSSILSIPVATALLVAGCNSGNSDSPSDIEASAKQAEAPQQVEVVSSETNETCVLIGEYFAVSAGLNQLSFTEAEKTAMVEGFKKGLTGETSMDSIQENINVVRDFLQTKHQEKSSIDSEQNKKAAAKFVANLKKDENVIFTESGLGYQIKKEGEGDKPTIADSVSVNYKGTLIDGTEFDSAMDENSPVTFPLAGVIPGFSEGLQLVGAGGEIRLYIPSELGYGDNPRPGSPIKAGAMLVFDVTIQEIQKASAEGSPIPGQIPPPPPPPPVEEE